MYGQRIIKFIVRNTRRTSDHNRNLEPILHADIPQSEAASITAVDSSQPSIVILTNDIIILFRLLAIESDSSRPLRVTPTNDIIIFSRLLAIESDSN